MNPTCSHGKRWDEECEGCNAISMGESLKLLTKDCQHVANALEDKPFMASDPRVVIDLFHTVSRLAAILRRAQQHNEQP